jgi:hypothetical protein
MRYAALILFLLAPALLEAQSTVQRDARLLAAPNGRALATFRADAPVQTGATRAGATLVTLQGYVHRSLIGAARDSFRISVDASNGALLRATAASDGRVLALLHNGMGLHEVSRRGEWVQVRRTAWVPTNAVARSRQAAAPAPRGATPPAPRAGSGAVASARRAQPADGAATDSAPGALDVESVAAALVSEDMTPLRRAELVGSPGGRAVGAVEPGTRVVPLARERGWVRVRVEGWVQEDALAMSDTTLRTALSAADIRSDPEGTRGRAVRWEVQLLAFQTADLLRRDMQPDEPYLLARGPASENALLYLALPPALVTEARGIPALTNVVITGRVRVGRSTPAGVPIVDVQSISRR